LLKGNVEEERPQHQELVTSEFADRSPTDRKAAGPGGSTSDAPVHHFGDAITPKY
jgi:hypothetical protein